jgi:hypothetical protein
MLGSIWRRWLGLLDRLRFAHTPCWLRNGRPSLAAPSPPRPELLVFVHGIYGSDQSGIDIGNFGDWPQRLQGDPRFGPRLDLRLFAYRSFNLGRSRRYSIPEHAARLRRDLDGIGAGRYERVHFIVHSMGGLILRQALLDAGRAPSAPWFHRLGALFLLATPSGGSKEAAWLARLGISETEAQQMRPGSPFLRRLQKAWSEALRARILGPREALRRGRMLLALGAELKGILVGEVVEPASVLAIGKHSRYRAFGLDHLQMAQAGPGNLAVYDWVAAELDAFLAAEDAPLASKKQFAVKKTRRRRRRRA